VADIDLGEDDGFRNITIGNTTLSIDVFDANNKIVALYAAFKDKPDDAYGAELAKVIASLGYPPVSQRMGQLFVEAIWKCMDEIKKKPSAPDASAASTTSTPAP
jgi:hypothetical protein